MSGISNIIAAGFGSWSTVNYVPTLGFGIGEEVIPTSVTITTTTTVIESESSIWDVCVAPSTVILETKAGVDITTETTVIASDSAGRINMEVSETVVVDAG